MIGPNRGVNARCTREYFGIVGVTRVHAAVVDLYATRSHVKSVELTVVQLGCAGGQLHMGGI